jgi:hypothetical protein
LSQYQADLIVLLSNAQLMKKTIAAFDVAFGGKADNCAANVRFGSKADMCSAQADVRFTPMCGRLRVGKDFLERVQHWSVQPCVRPFSAAHRAAGHNALRGSSPDQ